MRGLHLIALLMLVEVVVAQQSNYRPPLDGVLRLSGNFGEVRSNHFHTGLDLKTDGAEGKPVRAIADGAIVRVVVSPTGYGKALYIEHPDGRTSVYAHLREFSTVVQAYVKQQQYLEKKFGVDLTIPASTFKVKQGDVIAKSGNSGGSGGPHLHFELRETASEMALNPLEHGFKVADNRGPEMDRLWLYAHSKSGHVAGISPEMGFELEKHGLAYSVKNAGEVHALGAVSVGIEALDRFSDSDNACGIYSMTVSVNGKTIHHHTLKEMAFDKKRKVNAHIDFDKRVRNGAIVHRSYIAPANDLKLYDAITNRGMFTVEHGKNYAIRIDLKDYAGNVSSLDFTIKGALRQGDRVQAASATTDMFYPQRDNNFSNADMRVSIPAGCLYDTVAFRYAMKPACADCFSPIHSLHDRYTAMEDYMTVAMRIHPFKGANTKQLLIVSLDKNGTPVAEGGTVIGPWISTKTRSFGDYAVMRDSLAPELRPKNFTQTTTFSRIDTLLFFLRDDLAGIASYTATLNGQWVLLEHDPKNNLLYYVKDERFRTGQNTLRITATDKVGNIKELNLTLQ